MKNSIIVLIISFFAIIHFGYSQNNVNSLINQLDKAKNDTTKINIYLELSNEVEAEDSHKAIVYVLNAEKLAKETKHKNYLIYSRLSLLYINTAEFKKATDYTFLFLNETNKIKGDKKFDLQGTAYERLASIYQISNDLNLAVKYQMEAIASYKKIKGDNYYIIAYINLAKYLCDQKKIESALYYYRFVEENLESEGLTEYSSYVYNGIAACFQEQKKPEKAIAYFEKSKQAVLKYTPDDLSSLAITYNNIGNLQNDTKQHLSAVINLSEALELFKKIEDKRSMMDVYYNLSMAYRSVEQYKQSNDYMTQYVELKDSIFDAETKQTIHDISIKYATKYETEKKEQQNKLLSKENEKKQLSIYFALAGLALVFLILLIIFRNSKQKTKINRQLEDKNRIIEEKNHLVEEQNKDITDSIRYAERIQGAILPPKSKWNQILPNSFVFYKPKDILSGDFYWIAETDSHIYVAAADCTGHGVPGALISIVNFNLLNKAVLEKGLRETGEILNAVNFSLTESLHQSAHSSQIKDGMDVSIVAIERSQRKLQFTGANNPMYHFHSEGLTEYKGDKFPVGAFEGEVLPHFNTTEVTLQPGDMLYLFSDGYADQFGGPAGKKFKYKQLKDLFLEIKDKSMLDQRSELMRVFDEWKGDLEQVDDVLVIGVRI